jgi:hypothetical protein
MDLQRIRHECGESAHIVGKYYSEWLEPVLLQPVRESFFVVDNAKYVGEKRE